jgi:calcineurin-like phosphoesterase
VPTADYQIFDGGTAYMTDAGMCGDYDSILGMTKEEPVRRFVEKTPGSRLEAASGEGTLSGIAVETDDRTGLAMKVAAIRIGPRLWPSLPAFWEG